MKNIILCLLIFISSVKLFGQTQNIYDTIRRNEISASFLPAFVLLSGYDPVSRYGVFNFGYKHYFKSKRVFRASVSFSPKWTFNDQFQKFERRQDTLNIFSSHYASIKNKVQLNIGVEKIFRIRNFTHGVGAELILKTESYNYQNPVYWFPYYVDPTSRYAFDTYSYNTQIPGKIDNQIDSLSYSYDRKGYGIGLQLLYTLRYRINRHLYLSSSVGPYLVVMRYTNHHIDGNKALYKSNDTDFAPDGLLLFVADLSLAFRF